MGSVRYLILTFTSVLVAQTFVVSEIAEAQPVEYQLDQFLIYACGEPAAPLVLQKQFGNRVFVISEGFQNAAYGRETAEETYFFKVTKGFGG